MEPQNRVAAERHENGIAGDAIKIPLISAERSGKAAGPKIFTTPDPRDLRRPE